MLQNTVWFQLLLPLEHVRVEKLDLHPRSGCAFYGKGQNKCMTMQFANLWLSKSNGYTERNVGSGRYCYSGNIWHTRHIGKSCRACLRTAVNPCINTLHWMSLLRCLKHCSLEPRKRLCNQIIWQRNPGHCRNSWKQLRNWNWTNQRTNPGWSRRCSSTSPPTLQPKFYDYIIVCFQVAISLRAGDGLCSPCWRNIEKQHWSQTFGRLHPYDCSTKFLLTWYCTE